MYVVHYKPFSDPKLNRLELFNELSILAATYHLLMCTNWVSDGML